MSRCNDLANDEPARCTTLRSFHPTYTHTHTFTRGINFHEAIMGRYINRCHLEHLEQHSTPNLPTIIFSQNTISKQVPNTDRHLFLCYFISKSSNTYGTCLKLSHQQWNRWKKHQFLRGTFPQKPYGAWLAVLKEKWWARFALIAKPIITEVFYGSYVYAGQPEFPVC